MQQQVLVPPLNFALVAPNIYRSGYPNRKNFPFLRKLRLRSVVYICDDDYTPENLEFLQTEGIELFHIRIVGNKEPFVEIDQRDIASALAQYRIGCLVGCLRKLQRWSMASIFDEYRRFAGNSVKDADQEFIEVFDTSLVADKYLE